MENNSTVCDSDMGNGSGDCEMETGDVENVSDFGSDFDEMDDRPGTPDELIHAAGAATKNLLPFKSRNRYEQVYRNYEAWKASKRATSNSERVLLSYFSELGEKYSPGTLWARYSMLKSTMKINDNIDISTYSSVVALLKQKYRGYKPKKAKILTEDELRAFIENAPDADWLDVKVKKLLLIFVTLVVRNGLTIGRLYIRNIRSLSKR